MSDDYVDEKLKSFETELDETERKNNISYCAANVDAEKYLMFTHDELSSMSAQECAMAKYVISQHSVSIQKNLNRAIALRNWASRNLEILSSKDIVYDGTFFKYEVIRDKFIMNNSYAKKLSDIIIKEQGEIDSLSHIIASMKSMADSLSSLAYSKKETNGNY